MRYFTEMASRYVNCRYWHGSRAHALLHAVLAPWHANRNLHPEEG
jgi:hypothetical protein